MFNLSESGSRWRRWGLVLALAAVAAIVGITAYSAGWLRGGAAVAAPFNPADTDCASDAPYPKSAPEQVKWVLCQGRPAMVLFYSTRCRPCLMMDALVQMVKPDYKERVVFIEANYDDPHNAGLLRWARVGTLPASLFITDKGEVKRVAGQMNQPDLRAELDLLVVAE